jgi:hypothetical protein
MNSYSSIVLSVAMMLTLSWIGVDNIHSFMHMPFGEGSWLWGAALRVLVFQLTLLAALRRFASRSTRWSLITWGLFGYAFASALQLTGEFSPKYELRVFAVLFHLATIMLAYGLLRPAPRCCDAN